MVLVAGYAGVSTATVAVAAPYGTLPGLRAEMLDMRVIFRHPLDRPGRSQGRKSPAHVPTPLPGQDRLA